MGLKRKRSSFDVSPSSTSSSLSPSFSCDPSSPSPKYREFAMEVDPVPSDSISAWIYGGRDDSTSSILNSRTRKRFRDNRPDEQTIYGRSRTLDALGTCSNTESRKHAQQALPSPKTTAEHVANHFSAAAVKDFVRSAVDSALVLGSTAADESPDIFLYTCPSRTGIGTMSNLQWRPSIS
jgi:hypothetical protein